MERNGTAFFTSQTADKSREPSVHDGGEYKAEF
jgi:hypothetical protein